MPSRALTAERVGPATLIDWRLTFRRGVADVAPAPGRGVLGGLWLVTDSDLDGLDRSEGIRAGAYCRYPLPGRTDGGEVWADTYVMEADPGGRFVPPFGGYLRTVRRGLLEFGHATTELDRAIEEASCSC